MSYQDHTLGEKRYARKHQNDNYVTDIVIALHPPGLYPYVEPTSYGEAKDLMPEASAAAPPLRGPNLY